MVSLEDTLRALQLKAASGGKLNGKEKRMLAKAEKEGRLPPPLPEGDEVDGKKKSAAFSLPESWARALDAVSVHVRGGGADDEKSATGAVVGRPWPGCERARREAAGGRRATAAAPAGATLC